MATRAVRLERPKNIRKTLLSLLQYLKRQSGTLLIVALLVAISAGSNVYGTYLLKPVVNDYILPGDIPGLLKMLFFMGAVYLAGVAATFGYTQLMVKTAQKVVQEMRDDLFRKMQKLPLRFFDNTTHGELMSRFTNDIDTISEALNNSFAMLIQSFIMIIATFGVLIVLNFKLSIIVLVSFLGMFLFLNYSGKKSHQFFSRQQKCLGDLNGYTEEMIAGQKVVKLFNHEEADFAEFSKRSQKLQDAGVGAMTYSGLLIPVVVSISYLNYAISACIGAFFAISGMIDLGGLASYLVYVRQTALPINQFSQQMNFILAALSGAERFFEIMAVPAEIDEGTVTLVNVRRDGDGNLQKSDTRTGEWAWRRPAEDGSETLIPLRGDVRFQDVWFGYRPGQETLRDISLYAKPGQKIALVGTTGAGKTTIANLINRFYDVDSGSVIYDGIDVREIRKDDLRHSLAVVLQETHLFTGTIADNIRFGNPDATMEEIEAAAKLANADFFIRRLPEGYDTMLSGDGMNLSQGQRQLIAIARAAVSNPPVLILDEATSSVDSHTEKLIEKGMDHLMENRTVFVIAHRLSTVHNAKAIIVLENGKILERGSHDDLIAQQGRYYQFYTGQYELV